MKYLSALIIIFWFGGLGCLQTASKVVEFGELREYLTRDYKALGYNSLNEAYFYTIPVYGLPEYFQLYLLADEWRRFYFKFPDYWKISHRGFTSVHEGRHQIISYHAWRWTTINRMKNWDPNTTARLKKHQIESGDNPFKLIYALGPPQRVLWNSDWEVLIYKPDKALLLEGNTFKEERVCKGCWEVKDWEEGTEGAENPGMHEDEVIEKLTLNKR